MAHKDNIFLSIFPSFTFRLVGGSGDIKLTKDGNTLLKEMVQIKHHTTAYSDLDLLINLIENIWL